MKKLILMRHGVADDHFEGSDMSRPLTIEGEHLQKEMVDYLRKNGLDIDAILYSPFLRAEESARIIKNEYPKANFIKEPALGIVFDSYTILKHIDKNGFDGTLVVGHAPTLSAFGCSLLKKPIPLRFDKSEAIVFDFKNEIDFGLGEIGKVFSPRDLKR